jgi:hypothetical protein
MLHKLRPRSVYDVMAAIAFLIAVAGGSAYAAATIGSGNIKNDAVRSRHLKDGAVKLQDLAANSVGSEKVIDGSIGGRDIAEKTLGTVPNASKLGGKPLASFGQSLVSFDVNGPLPATSEFTSHGGALYVTASASAYRSSAKANGPGMIGVSLGIDGLAAPFLSVYTNELDSHKTLAGVPVLYDYIGAGKHTLEVKPIEDASCKTGFESTHTYCTTTNTDDRVAISVIEFPRE